MYNVHCTMYNVHCTLYIVLYIFLNYHNIIQVAYCNHNYIDNTIGIMLN